jgi:pilus assembly protein Flp/PilA
MQCNSAADAATRSKETEMLAFLNNLRALGKNERGVTALEYGLIAGLVAVAIVSSITTLGTTLSATFTSIANSL